jgi:hypothetical protein
MAQKYKKTGLLPAGGLLHYGLYPGNNNII